MEATTNATTKTTYLRETTLRYGKKVKVEPMRDPEAVARLFRKVVKDNTREHFVAFYLDGAHEVVAYSVAHVGTANACIAHPREVFRPAVLAGACAVVVAHNHPSGRRCRARKTDGCRRALRRRARCSGSSCWTRSS